MGTYTGMRGCILAVLASLATGVAAEDLSAGVVADKMKPDERYTYVAGVVEGLAYARFVQDGQSEEPGMRCIYQWFYNEDGTVDQIFAAYRAFPDHLPGAVTAALIKRRCG